MEGKARHIVCDLDFCCRLISCSKASLINFVYQEHTAQLLYVMVRLVHCKTSIPECLALG